MPCDQSSLAVRPACQRYESYRLQRQLLAQFLCAVLAELDEGFTCNEAALDARATPTEGVCVGEAVFRQIQAANIAEGLEVDVNLLNCKSDAQIERIIASLECSIIEAINPAP